MRVTNYANLSAEHLAAAEAALPEHKTLGEVMTWALAQPAGTFIPQVVSEVVVQDEFSHDVIIPWHKGLYLVYGTT